MLDSDEIQRTRQQLAALSGPVTIWLDPGDDPDDPFFMVMREVLQEISSESGGLVHLHEHGALRIQDGRPGFTLGDRDQIQFLAVPGGPELDPFLELLLGLAARTRVTDPALAPGHLDVLVAPTCPNCLRVVRACLELALANPQIKLRIIDVQYFSDLASGVRSVPAVIIDGTFTIVGETSAQHLQQVLTRRTDPDHLGLSLMSMVEAGRLDDAVPLLISDEGLASLPRLLQEGGLKERLGVMVLCENALDQDPHCLDASLPYLLPLLEHPDANLRGDTADLLGKIGAPGAVELLSRLLHDEVEDIRDIAREALDSLRQPS